MYAILLSFPMERSREEAFLFLLFFLSVHTTYYFIHVDTYLIEFFKIACGVPSYFYNFRYFLYKDTARQNPNFEQRSE